MLMLPLILLDIISGVLLIANLSSFAFWPGTLSFLKGCWSLFTSIKMGYYFDWMGAVDLFGGICLLLFFRGIYFEFFIYAGIALVVKAVYCFVAAPKS